MECAAPGGALDSRKSKNASDASNYVKFVLACNNFWLGVGNYSHTRAGY